MTLGSPRALLETEISTLDTFLLAAIKTSPPDPLDAGDFIAVRAYIVLCHAAIEEFLEAVFSTYVNGCLVMDDRGRVHPGTYLTVLQLSEAITGRVNKADRSPQAILSQIAPLYRERVIKPNHGIKPLPNIQNMALGAGLAWNELDAACPNLMAALPTLAAGRGDIAHLSSFGLDPQESGVRRTHYPDNARQMTADVLKGVPELLDYLERQTMPGLKTRGSITRQRALRVRVGRFLGLGGRHST